MLVFLDIDGVLNQLQRNYYIDEKCVKALGKITSKVVLVTTWKHGWCRDINRCTPQVQNLVKILNKHGVQIIGKTKDMDYRDEECKRYVLEHNVKEDYIILDDDLKLYKDKTKLYPVDCTTGFTGMKKRRKLFGGTK